MLSPIRFAWPVQRQAQPIVPEIKPSQSGIHAALLLSPSAQTKPQASLPLLLHTPLLTATVCTFKYAHVHIVFCVGGCLLVI